jgi:hypothetical protein
VKRLLLAFLLGLASPVQAQQAVVIPATIVSVPVTGTIADATVVVAGAPGEMDLRHGSRACPVATAVETFTQGTGAACAGGTSNLSGTMTFAAGQTISTLGLGGVTVVHLDVGGGLSVHRREDRPGPSRSGERLVIVSGLDGRC